MVASATDAAGRPLARRSNPWDDGQVRCLEPALLILLLAAAGIAGCGDPSPSGGGTGVRPPPTFVMAEARPSTRGAGEVIDRVRVSQAQVDAATALGVPVAFQSPRRDGTFVFIPAGTFLMGSPPGETGRDPSEVQHRVHIDRGFYIMTAPRGWTPNGGALGGSPTRRASATELAQRLSATDPLHDYRLPTEAEWEYAYRAGTQTRWWWGDERLPAKADIASYDTNPWGLRLMGRLRDGEWCLDGYADLPSWEVSDPHGPVGESSFVVRGRHLDKRADGEPLWDRSAARSSLAPDKLAWVRLVAPVGYGLGAYGSGQVTFRLVDREQQDAPNKDYDLRVVSMNDRLAARNLQQDAEWKRVAKPALPTTLSMVPGAYYVYAEGRRDGRLVRGVERKFHVAAGASEVSVPVPDADLSRFGSGAEEGPK